MFSQKKNINAKHLDKKGSANSVDPDQTVKEQSDQDLHCLPFCQYF